MKNQTLRSIVHTVGLVAMVFVLANCGKKNEGTKVDARSVSALGGKWDNGVTVDPNVRLSGTVRYDASYQNEFNESVRDFMERLLPSRDYVGYVSSTGEYGTGITFGGRIEFTNGSLRNTNVQLTVAQTSRLSIKIKDYFNETEKPPELPVMGFARGEGYVSGNQARIKFYDSYGWVQLEGRFDQSRFTGELRYDNQNTKYRGGPGYAGLIGNFDIPTCELFNCN